MVESAGGGRVVGSDVGETAGIQQKVAGDPTKLRVQAAQSTLRLGLRHLVIWSFSPSVTGDSTFSWYFLPIE